MKVSVIGASGYTGGELFRLLCNHREVEIVGAYGKTTIGKDLSEVHPSLQDIVDLTIEEPKYREVGESSDLVFTATSHGVAMKFVPDLLDEDARVIDISADYRLDDVRVYEEYYQKHESPGLEAVYGLSEIYRSEIEKADLVANPGCYPTAAILSLAPLFSEELIDLEHIVIDSKSGTSGAGAKPSQKLHHPTCAENLRAYNVTAHRHSPEIKQEVEKLAGGEATIHFTPHLIPITRGILNTSHVFPQDTVDEDKLIELYENFYDDEPFVRVLERLPQTNAVRGSNFCDVGLEVSENSGRIVAISAIDNLVKGASGQAIQNMNIMFGFDERMGLEEIALRP
ncbi:N-acetyl-gamma-glutamyl-phosphate reductase [candidate division MSBL1 archaeon SCGC-AAA259D18]|uniref:N-acetyl-gamma-glutamyl-phosphate reductase n=2 Tax=candidate division MSBL1 TaxID=215777 RepID=A0A133UAY9_9EURY|nr:N-acetyl-gamma-glutamyl-phosphate reductase [candidate division MSBL1 archaeon SCGC-AAA259A05]KXA92015.1 N-acetyl-gamma-glutamyl-phosphate reductase [candidate division MSBL1 archaeon SCGC-AAA259D18]